MRQWRQNATDPFARFEEVTSREDPRGEQLQIAMHGDNSGARNAANASSETFAGDQTPGLGTR
jgi:hypothetical protein